METPNRLREQLRALVASLGEEDRAALHTELSSAVAPPRPGIAMEEITPARMRDADFSARVRNEIEAALRGEI